MSWESSSVYYRLINEEVKARMGGLHSAKCILYSVDFAEIERYQAEGDWESAGRLLGDAARSLELAGAEIILICANTMHSVIGSIEEKTSLPILHIADATANQIHKSDIKSVGLLGTKYTMEMDFYRLRLESHGINVLVPDNEDREVINRIIYEELCKGEIRPSSRDYYIKVIKSLVEDGAEGIILGCTEIGLLLNQDDSEVPLFDTAMIHAVEAVNKALES